MAMCNLYSVTTNVEANWAFVRNMRVDEVTNGNFCRGPASFRLFGAHRPQLRRHARTDQNTLGYAGFFGRAARWRYRRFSVRFAEKR